MINMKPKEAIKLDILKLYKSETYPKEEVLLQDGLYRYLYQPGEQHEDKKRRATDLAWSKNTYRLDQVVENPRNCVLYYLQGGPDRDFIPEQFMHILKDT